MMDELMRMYSDRSSGQVSNGDDGLVLNDGQQAYKITIAKTISRQAHYFDKNPNPRIDIENKSC